MASPVICAPSEQSYVASEPGKFVGQSVGNGQCVAFVKAAAGTPATSFWKEGIKVRGNGSSLKAGTAIATFTDGAYPSHVTGNHAAIFISETSDGIWVYDQWKSATSTQPVHKRLIRFRGGVGSASNDGDRFSVIVTPRMVTCK